MCGPASAPFGPYNGSTALTAAYASDSPCLTEAAYAPASTTKRGSRACTPVPAAEAGESRGPAWELLTCGRNPHRDLADGHVALAHVVGGGTLVRPDEWAGLALRKWLFQQGRLHLFGRCSHCKEHVAPASSRIHVHASASALHAPTSSRVLV